MEAETGVMLPLAKELLATHHLTQSCLPFPKLPGGFILPRHWSHCPCSRTPSSHFLGPSLTEPLPRHSSRLVTSARGLRIIPRHLWGPVLTMLYRKYLFLGQITSQNPEFNTNSNSCPLLANVPNIIQSVLHIWICLILQHSYDVSSFPFLQIRKLRWRSNLTRDPQLVKWRRQESNPNPSPEFLFSPPHLLDFAARDT